jgi:hypothetical protein
MTNDCSQQGYKFGDHFARHPKTAGRTFTGGAVFSEKTFIDSKRHSSRTRAKILTHHSLMKIIRRIAANELLGERKKPSMETGGNQKTYSHFLSHFD